MSTIPNAKLLCASSPFARRGALWGAYETHFGQEDAAPLVWQATTRQMNPTVRQSVIDRRMAEDEASARAEYLAEFRSELEAFVKLETVQGCTGTYVARPFNSAHRYYGFVDPSGGSEDAFTLAISHREKTTTSTSMPFLRGTRHSRRANIVEEFARLLQTYRIGMVTGDRYGGEFPRELFRRHGIEYRISPRTKSGALPKSAAAPEFEPHHPSEIRFAGEAASRAATPRVGCWQGNHRPRKAEDRS